MLVSLHTFHMAVFIGVYVIDLLPSTTSTKLPLFSLDSLLCVWTIDRVEWDVSSTRIDVFSLLILTQFTP